MRIVIATVHIPFVRGGAEELVEDLERAILARGHRVEVVAIPWKWFPAGSILDHIAAFRLLDLSHCPAGPIDLFIGLKFPAYLIPHPNKVFWLVHQHRLAYDLWENRYGLSHDPRGAQIREAILRADRQAVAEARQVFTISTNVSKRLEDYLGAGSSPLYPPPRRAGQMVCSPSEDYLFFPSRVTPLKRQDLVLHALALTEQPVRVRFAGSAEPAAYAEEMRALADALGVADRAEWLDWVSEPELIRNYAAAIGVLFPPRDEDYGFVTLEAMLASKPVITCDDSGEALEFIRHRQTGLVAAPAAQELAAAMDELWEDRDRARRWGEAGRQVYDSFDIGWNKVLDALLA